MLGLGCVGQGSFELSRNFERVETTGGSSDCLVMSLRSEERSLKHTL
jgi:hypothetical protein